MEQGSEKEAKTWGCRKAVFIALNTDHRVTQSSQKTIYQRWLGKGSVIIPHKAPRPYQPGTSIRETQVSADLTWTKSMSKLSCPNASVLWPNQLITISQNGNGYKIKAIFINISSKILHLLHITNCKWNIKFSSFSRWQNVSLLVVELIEQLLCVFLCIFALSPK